MNTSDVYNYFDRVYVINLDRRRDRWERFVKGIPPAWPFGPPIRFAAVDGMKDTPPAHWHENEGAWGCYRSHVNILQHAIDHDLHRILILEDDAAFCENFSSHVSQFLSRLPDDWKLVYLGGQHIELHSGRPTRVNELVYSPYNVNRTHAYALQGQNAIREIHSFLTDPSNWTEKQHVDHFLGAYQKRSNRGIYVPQKWLIAQDVGTSDIAHETTGFRAFLGAEDIVHPTLMLPMTAVVGPFGCGAGTIAGALHHLGIPMGRAFHSTDESDGLGYYEAAELTNMCRSMFEEPWMTPRGTRHNRVELLKIWAAGHTRTFQSACRLAGGKHPSFCLLGNELVEAWNNPILIVVDRDEQDTVSSLARRAPGWSLDACWAVTQHLIASREAFLHATRAPFIRIAFEDFKRQPRTALNRIASFLGIAPTDKAMDEAESFSQSG